MCIYIYIYIYIYAHLYIIYMRLTQWLSAKESACNAGDTGSIPGSGRSPGEGKGNPLQYSFLGNPMDRVALWAIVHEFSKQSWQRLNNDENIIYMYKGNKCVYKHIHLHIHTFGHNIFWLYISFHFPFTCKSPKIWNKFHSLSTLVIFSYCQTPPSATDDSSKPHGGAWTFQLLLSGGTHCTLNFLKE